MSGGGALRAALVIVTAALGVTAGPAAAADPPDPGSTQTFTYGSGLTAHPYIVYVPTTYDASHPAPLVVMTHGCQTTAEQQMRANLYNRVAEREGLVVLYPDINPIEAAQPGPLARCWQFPSPLSWQRDGGDAAAIAAMTRAVMGRWQIDGERVYMVGMSAGSFMTSIMAAAYPDLFAAVAIMAGGAYADPLCLLGNPASTPVALSAQLAFAQMGSRARVIPRLVMGGDADTGITPACADKALAQGLRTNNLVISGTQEAPIALSPASVRAEANPGGYASTVSTYRDPAGCLIGERWMIHGMNHFWSGGSSDPQWKNFTDPKGPSGAEATWRFLSRYTKSTTAMPCAEAPVTSSAPASNRCPARWLSLRLPANATAVRATVNGRRVTTRVARGRVRVRLPAGRRTKTSVVLRGGTRGGKRFRIRRAYTGCGPRR
jgi:poly(hydroxyalkanoate) depolymerase family esterase